MPDRLTLAEVKEKARAAVLRELETEARDISTDEIARRVRRRYHHIISDLQQVWLELGERRLCETGSLERQQYEDLNTLMEEYRRERLTEYHLTAAQWYAEGCPPTSKGKTDAG